MSSEIIRLISNLCSFWTIIETKSTNGWELAKVKIDDRVTDFFPIASKSNSFKKHYIPARVGEQVTVFCPFGEANIGFILPSIFNKSSKEPNGASNTREVVTYEDGTTFFYDTKSKELNVNCVGDVKIKAGGNINIEASGNFAVNAAKIDLN